MNIPLLLVGLLAILPFSLATSLTDCTLEDISSSANLTWCPCNEGFFCARLDVPLDYQNPGVGRASVPLIKYPAQSNSSAGPYQGMILLNPGGPGASGVDEALNGGNLIQSFVGTNWDIVGFDIRGGWRSLPLANCSGNLNSNQSSALGTRSVPRVLDGYFIDSIELGKEVGEQCEKLAGKETDAGSHMSTATIARDMLSIVMAFSRTDDGKRASKPSELLNYYGISYGTFLGQTFASMFPESVGNVVLDGVVSPEGYFTNFTSQAIYHLDGVIAAFFIYCHSAGPSACPFYTGSTPMDIYKRFNQSFVQLDPKKAEAENWSNVTDIEAALFALKLGLLSAADSPLSYFTSLPQVFLGLEDALSTQNLTGWTQQVTVIGQGKTAAPPPEWSSGVQCSDQSNTWYNKTLEDFRPLINQLEEQSIIGEIWSHGQLGCLGWPIKASEIFTGPFGGDTATPILFVGNTYDPVTPIENAISSAPNYKNAQVLTVDGIGHTSDASLNKCGLRKIGVYFQTNQLPGNDSYCPLEVGPFNIVLNGTLNDNIEQAGLSDLVALGCS